MYKPIIIIGAPRSGTNMLRDMLTSISGVGSWPCDEINYIWRHGNLRYPSDAFIPAMATGPVIRYVRRKFANFAERGHFDFVVEKTCANSLRIGYVDKVFPDAVYIYILRDGIDVSASAVQRWKAPFDLQYVLKKARFVPWQDMFYYAFRYLGNHAYRLFSDDKQLAFWGPKLDNMRHIVSNYALDEVCALQWQACIDASDRFFSQGAQGRVMHVRYESFVSAPRAELQKICDFIGIRFDASTMGHRLREVSSNSVGKGRIQLGKATVERLTRLIGATLSKHDYS